MTHLFYIALGVIPGVFWLWFFYRRDKNPEPPALFLKVFAIGALMVFPTALIMSPFTGLGVYSATIFTPIVEETLKFMVVLVVVYRHREFDEPTDGLVYAAASALGFATLENVVYMFRSHPAGQVIPLDALILPGAVWDTAWLRAIASVPTHVLDSAYWGYALAIARFSGTKRPGLVVGTGLVLSWVQHGLFNAMALKGLEWMNNDAELFGTLFLTFLLLIWLPFRYFEASTGSGGKANWPLASRDGNQPGSDEG